MKSWCGLATDWVDVMSCCVVFGRGWVMHAGCESESSQGGKGFCVGCVGVCIWFWFGCLGN